MTDENQIEDQDVELHDDESEVMEAMHGGKKMKKADEAMHGGGFDGKNAEAQSVASVDKAADATGTAPKRKMAGGTASDNTTQDPMPKTKAGMINAMAMKMSKANKPLLTQMYGEMMKMYDDVDADQFDGESLAEKQEIDYQVDFSEDLTALVESEATLSDEFKQKAETIFEAAIKSKLAEEIDRLEEKYHEELEAEINTTKDELIEKVDSYLNYVVEQWLEDNKLAVQTGLRTEIAENFMNSLKDLFTENYIEVPESKVDLVDDLAEQVEELEDKLNTTTATAIEMAEELENYKRDAVIAEASKDLADTQAEKLKSLVADIDFDDEETFAQKVATVKESYFTKKATKTITESADFESDTEDETVEVTGSMAQYISALNRTSKK